MPHLHEPTCMNHSGLGNTYAAGTAGAISAAASVDDSVSPAAAADSIVQSTRLASPAASAAPASVGTIVQQPPILASTSAPAVGSSGLLPRLLALLAPPQGRLGRTGSPMYATRVTVLQGFPRHQAGGDFGGQVSGLQGFSHVRSGTGLGRTASPLYATRVTVL